LLAALNRNPTYPRPPRNPPRHAGGFSLIELLIVVAIIALLITMLIPALGRAKDMARLVICQHQLKQWATAFHLYTVKNKGFYPHVDGRDRCGDEPGYSLADQADWWYGWVDVLPMLMGDRPWREHRPWNYPGRGTIFQCPAAKPAPQTAYAYNPHRNGYFSYAMNSCLELDENCWRAPGDGGIPMPSFLDTSLIVRPQRVILLFDQLLAPRRGYGGDGWYRNAGKYCGSYPKAFSARHAHDDSALGGSILYCDYHVEWAETVWKPSWPADLEIPPRDDPQWFPYPP